MYLARGVLNPVSRDVLRDLADPVELHRTVMRAFPDDAGPSPRQAFGVLHRVDEDRRRGWRVLLVQSAARPDFERLPEAYFLPPEDDLDLALGGDGRNPSVRSVAEERGGIAAGDRFFFRLRANTTKKILTKSLADGTKQNGKRVPVEGDVARLQWLARHAAASGFELDDVRVRELQPISKRRKDEKQRTFAGAIFEGTLRVVDAETFRRKALADGIGPAKAYGFGLLSILRAD
jgi:CRISPR system Cascade subunit CasE